MSDHKNCSVGVRTASWTPLVSKANKSIKGETPVLFPLMVSDGTDGSPTLLCNICKNVDWLLSRERSFPDPGAAAEVKHVGAIARPSSEELARTASVPIIFNFSVRAICCRAFSTRKGCGVECNCSANVGCFAIVGGSVSTGRSANVSCSVSAGCWASASCSKSIVEFEEATELFVFAARLLAPGTICNRRCVQREFWILSEYYWTFKNY